MATGIRQAERRTHRCSRASGGRNRDNLTRPYCGEPLLSEVRGLTLEKLILLAGVVKQDAEVPTTTRSRASLDLDVQTLNPYPLTHFRSPQPLAWSPKSPRPYNPKPSSLSPTTLTLKNLNPTTLNPKTLQHYTLNPTALNPQPYNPKAYSPKAQISLLLRRLLLAPVRRPTKDFHDHKSSHFKAKTPMVQG